MRALLNSCSHYSILYGVLSPEKLIGLLAANGYDSVALMDIDNLYALPLFLHACDTYKIRPIIGTQLTEKNDPSKRVLVYAHGEIGYSSLCKSITSRQCDENFDLVKTLRENCAGLHVATDNVKLINSLLGQISVYYALYSPKIIPRSVLELNLPCLIAPSLFLRDQQDLDLHLLLRAIDTNTTLSRVKENAVGSLRNCIRHCDQIKIEFENFPKAIEDTENFVKNLSTKENFYEPIMPIYKSDCNSAELLKQKAYDGAVWRYGEVSSIVRNRLEYELSLINSKGFSDYFLIVDDIVQQSPRTCGRGSGAASLVSYCLGITNVDPIRYNLMFERFLNPGRKDPPDIDVDFAWDERDDVIQYVFDKYGKDHVAMVATHLTCGARMAIRETARVYGLTEEEISNVSKRIPHFWEPLDDNFSLEQNIKAWPTLKGVQLDQPWPAILKHASRLIGMPRGIGTHCGGVIITPQPISNYVPVQISAKGIPIIQWEKDGTEEMGLVKIDLLGNRSLAVIRDAIDNVKKEYPSFSEVNWDPQSDFKTIELLKAGETIGVFYVESPAMRLLQKKSKVGDFEHLVIHSSIIRPAANEYIREYIKRLHGGKFTVVHPVLLEVLTETYGIMVYQEDVSKIAMALASFSVEDADMLRKILSKKKSHKKFNDFREAFFRGALSNGATEEACHSIWNMMLSFSGYSFCKPHSASYVQVSFQSAYLKAHFPAAFMAAVLSNYGGFYSTQAYIGEALRLGLTVIPPDINRSEEKYFSSGSVIVVGFCQIKGLSIAAIKNILIERNAKGDYVSLHNFLQRLTIQESDVECLIFAGCFDKLESKNRAEQFWILRTFFQKESATPPKLPNLSYQQILNYQYRVLGFLTDLHPISLIRLSRQRTLVKIKDVDKNLSKRVTFLGWCITSKTVSSKKGEAMEFVTFSDETGICETVVFPNVYKIFAALIHWHEAFVVSGKVTQEFGVSVVEVDFIERP